MTFSSCSDDDLVDIQAEVVLPSDANLMELEAWSYVVPLDIKSNSEWRIEKNGDFFDVIPSEGEGNATVEIHVTDNIYEERQNGELRIVFPNDESKNMILNLQQKWEGDYDENDNATATVGPKKYALGYGYNVMEQYANSASVKGQIFRMNELY
ncbi:MAG: BACON domain-containing protein, partial [Bacteroidaceae bacterium]|nr:BACON domain-containing protein [Bacteroidaceae bacterium]